MKPFLVIYIAVVAHIAILSLDIFFYLYLKRQSCKSETNKFLVYPQVCTQSCRRKNGVILILLMKLLRR